MIMNQDKIIAELIKLNTQAFITIDAARKAFDEIEDFVELNEFNYTLFDNFQNLHCEIEENLTELQKQNNA